MQERLMKYLNHLEDLAGKTEDFAAEQVPLYIQELLTWMFWDSVMCAAFAALILVISLVLVGFGFKLLEHAKKTKDDGLEFFGGMTVILMAILAVVCLLPICINTKQAVKISVAPRVVIVEELKKLTR